MPHSLQPDTNELLQHTPTEGEGKILEIEEAILEVLIDIEEYFKTDRKPPRARSYRIRVDREHLVVHAETITGRGILELAGKVPPERFTLRQKLRGGHLRKIELDGVVDLREPGVECFKTLPRDQTEG
jgi:hypothetical protein